jgi:hypothetical protein
MAQDLLEPLHHSLRRIVLRIDDQRSSGDREGADLVAPLKGDASQADDRDRVARIRCRDLLVEDFGTIEQANG